MIQGEVGQYKLAYVSPNSADVLVSDMFDTYNAMVTFQKENKIQDYFYMQNTAENGAHYEWKFLNNGLYIPYKIAWFFKQHWLEMVIVVGAILAVWYYTAKSKTNLNPPML